MQQFLSNLWHRFAYALHWSEKWEKGKRYSTSWKSLTIKKFTHRQTHTHKHCYGDQNYIPPHTSYARGITSGFVDIGWTHKLPFELRPLCLTLTLTQHHWNVHEGSAHHLNRRNILPMLQENPKRYGVDTKFIIWTLTSKSDFDLHSTSLKCGFCTYSQYEHLIHVSEPETKT